MSSMSTCPLSLLHSGTQHSEGIINTFRHSCHRIMFKLRINQILNIFSAYYTAGRMGKQAIACPISGFQ